MGDLAARVTSLGGLFLMMALALAFAENRRRISLRLVLAGLGLQLLFAVLVLRTGPGQAFFEGAKHAFDFLLAASDEGAAFLFGKLVTDLDIKAVVAFKVLPIVIFVSARAR